MIIITILLFIYLFIQKSYNFLIWSLLELPIIYTKLRVVLQIHFKMLNFSLLFLFP